MQHLVHRLTLYVVLVVLALIGAATFSLFLLVNQLPAEPSPALVGLLSGVTTGIVGALGAVVGALGGAYVAIASFRSARQTTGARTDFIDSQTTDT